MKSTNQRIAIVTGASRMNGIGAATCLQLAKAGVDIFLTTYSPYDQEVYENERVSDGEELLFHIRKEGVQAEKMEVDLSKVESAQVIMDTVNSKLGAPSILVNNAAYSINQTYESLTSLDLDNHYAVNVKGTALLSCEFARRFSKGKGGRIVNLVSGQRKPMPGEIAYATTKGAVEAFTISLSAEVAEKGISVNAIDPGPTDTGWMSHEVQKDLRSLFPMGRIGEAKDAAKVIAFLCSDEAEWITGQVIRSDGGFRG